MSMFVVVAGVAVVLLLVLGAVGGLVLFLVMRPRGSDQQPPAPGPQYPPHGPHQPPRT
ncbi:MAG: hypothetical protein ACRDT8_12990 [Micromonosporaceae bacterium]